MEIEGLGHSFQRELFDYTLIINDIIIKNSSKERDRKIKELNNGSR